MNRAFAPGLFVVLWSTGFISAKFGLPYTGPLTYLLLRFALVTALMAAIAVVMRAAWPARGMTWVHVAFVGVLVHGLYLGGVFVAIARGMPAGTAAMLVGIQPILTVFIARWFGERTAPKQWLGLLIGLAGVYCVVEHKMRLIGLDLIGFAAITTALFAISIGTLHQKRHATGVDMRAGAVIQFGACTVMFAILTPLFETLHIDWTWQFQFALAWSVLVLSVGAISILYRLLRRGAAADVARLFYMVPAVTMVMAWLLFGEPITVLAVAGMVLIAIGVVLARPPALPVLARGSA
jgi:drug/metabolite transporter (DMT)-like permease